MRAATDSLSNPGHKKNKQSFGKVQSEIHTINKRLKTSPFDYNISKEGSKVDNHYYYEHEMNKDTNKDLVNFAEVKLNFLVDAADNLVVSSSQLGEKMDRSELERELQPSNSDILVDPVNFANKDSFLQLDDDDDANLF